MADLFTWKPEYSVGVHAFDAQHKRLVAMLNALHNAMSQGEAHSVLYKLFWDLVNYTRTHFEAEERMMEKHNFPALMQHRSEHQELTQRVNELYRQFEAGSTTVSVTVLDFLRDWLKHHILETDRQYSAFLTAKGEV